MKQVFRRVALQGSVIAVAIASGIAISGASQPAASGASVHAMQASAMTDAILRGAQGDVHNLALRVADNTPSSVAKVHQWADARADRDHAPLVLHHWPDARDGKDNAPLVLHHWPDAR